MRLKLSITLTLFLLLSMLAIAPASADEAADHGFATAWVVDSAFTDIIGRLATEAEHEQWDTALTLTHTESDLRASLFGTKLFFESVGGNSNAFVNAVYEHIVDRSATAVEVRDARISMRNTEGTPAAKRRRFARQFMEQNRFDADRFRATRVIVDRTNEGVVQRVGILFPTAVDPSATSLSIAIDGEVVEGRVTTRREGRLLTLLPSSPEKLSGRVVASAAITTGPIPLRADAASRIDPIFEPLSPAIRMVAYYGNHQTSLLGVLGETGPEAAAARVKAAAAPFSEPGRPAVGAFELIATVAQASAGADGNYSTPSHLEDLQAWIDVAREHDLYVILDIQPGRSDFLTESKRYESLLLEPHVGLALDPEWRMKPHQRPGEVIGQVSAAEVNSVSAWLSDLVVENGLPEKVFMVHQFQTRMITDRQDLIDRPGLATVIHADGFGGRAIKLTTYATIKVDEPFWNGFKLFIDEDTNIFRPADVLDFTNVPVPDLITYQ